MKTKIALAALLTSSLSYSQERLMVVGGGNRPPAAMERFATQAISSPKTSNVLVITWATESPQEYADAFMEDLLPHYQGLTTFSLERPYSIEARENFLDQLSQATAVFFTGGDQSNVMDVVESNGDASIYEALHSTYSHGVIFGGTSAGTAIMSKTMIVGDMENGVTPLRAGLGFISPAIIVDQHFSQRNRKKRLLAALNQTSKNIGIGVDEDTALFVNDLENYDVVGANKVKVYIRSKSKNNFSEDIYQDEDSFQIKELSGSVLNL